MRAVRFVVVALLVSLLTAVLAGPASGYVIGGKRWPGHVIRYHNAFGADRQAVAAAVRDWNTSGVDVRFVAVPASQAQVTIVAMPGDFFPTVKLPGVGVVSSDAAGFASVGEVPRGLTLPSPSGRERFRGAHVWLWKVGSRHNGIAVSEGTMARIAVHELGHVLGLGHEPHTCAVMNAAFGSACHAPHPWIGLCADPLQPDDIRGADALYGGRPAHGGPRLCVIAPLPGHVHRLAAHIVDHSDGKAAVGWTDPAGVSLRAQSIDPYTLDGQRSVHGYEVNGVKGDCHGQVGRLLASDVARAGNPVRTLVYLTPGKWCLRVRILDDFNRQGPVTTIVVTVPAPGGPGAGTAPKAMFDAPEAFAGQPASFRSESQPGYTPIARWEWTFGDSAISSAENSQHTYTKPGTYTVTLTVTDSDGLASHVSHQVVVQAVQPPIVAILGPGEVSAGNDAFFTDNSTPGTTSVIAWAWNFGDGASSSEQNPDHVYAQPGTYAVTLTVTDQDGSSSTASDAITVDPPDPTDPSSPNARAERGEYAPWTRHRSRAR